MEKKDQKNSGKKSDDFVESVKETAKKTAEKVKEGAKEIVKDIDENTKEFQQKAKQKPKCSNTSDIAVLILIYSIIQRKTSIYKKIIFALLALWFFGFLLLLHSITGVLTLATAVTLRMFYYAFNSASGTKRIAVVAGGILIPAIIGIYSWKQINDFYTINASEHQISTQTAKGNPYYHNLNNNQLENGHYIWRNVSRKELEDSWNKRSSLLFNGKDLKGQQLYATLIRYLASKGLKKDAEGMLQLTDKDINAVENGIANYKFVDSNSFGLRIYRIIWEFDSFLNGQNPM